MGSAEREKIGGIEIRSGLDRLANALIILLLVSAATCTASAQDDENPAMVLYNNTVVLTEGTFTFVPSNNVSASYEISNSTDLGALYATGLDFNVSDMGKMAGNDSGNMTEKSLILESIEGYQNNNETQEKWFILINDVQAPDDIGMNQVSDGDEVKFLYTLEEGGEPVLAEAKYVVMIKVAIEAPPEANDLIETATQAGNFTTLLAAIEAANLTDTLKEEGSYTVFAPTDEAFNALPNGTVEGLLNDTDALKNILLYHVSGEKLMAADVVNMTNITTLQGSELPVNVTEEGVFVGKAKITMQDVDASNGVIHVIDAVLTPPAGPSEEKDIIETATSKGFKTLRSALNATNLTDTLKGEGPYTLFAPTDNAFAALPNGTLEALLNDTDALRNILLYHVAGEKLMAADVVNMTNITTLQGSELPVNVTEEGVFVGDAKIILQDLEASNGVIHAIDAVLIPLDEGEKEPTVLYNDAVNLTEGNFTFMPENVSQSYQVDNFTDFGALYAAGIDFNASVLQNMTNMTSASFILQGIEGIKNNNTTGEKWFFYINGEPAKENFGMNFVSAGDKLSFWYTTEEGGKAVIENARYVANITVAELRARATIVQAAQNQTRLTTFVNAVQTVNLTQTLNGTEPYTVCIPSNEAFNKLPVETRNKLMNNTTLLRDVLSYHVLNGRFTREQFIGMNNVTNIQGNVLQINTIGNNVKIQNVNIIQIIIVNNGVICIIDEVLIPPGSGLPSDGNQTDGNQTDGNQTDGNQTDDNQTENWHFFSIPFEANNTSVDYLLSDVNYTSLIYYNASTKLFEDVSNIEPLKGYWISVPNGTEFNASAQFASFEKKQVTAPPSLKTYPGWNALGSPVNETVPAEAAFITIDSLYAKIKGPWVPGNNTTGYYQYVGYNGFNGTISETQFGTDEFEVKPYEGYWVFVIGENLYA